MSHPDDNAQMVSGRSAVDAGERTLAAGLAEFGADWKPNVTASASGRIELLGNHLDYNGGPVLAAAIDRQVVAMLATNAESQGIEAILSDIGAERTTFEPATLHDWRNIAGDITPGNYLRGVIAALLSRGKTMRGGGQLVVAGDVPIGLGVSSSAALCVALTMALCAEELSDDDVVLTAQEGEHRAGTPCGTMDQSASVSGGVIRFNGASREIERLDPQLGELVFIIAVSGVDRSLGTSVYPRRVEESRRALELANAALPVALDHLAAMTREELSELERRKVLEGTLLERCRHIVYETERVDAGEHAIRAGDWKHFGELMTASGRSSATDYEVSHPRVEELVGLLTAMPEVLGARMMGGGGGGSVLGLASAGSLDDIETRLRREYYSVYGMGDRRGVVQRCRFGPAAAREIY
jgi:galactokinase